METPGHLLSLKVMRISRPSLGSSWQPFFTSSPSFSAHATESLLSLQGKEALPGHPKTLRDLTHASELLTLPSTFGAIQLGETFRSCLCVNNDVDIDIEGVTLRVEMQTASSKVILAEVGGPMQKLRATDVMEVLVSHEMKELGQHVLGCYVGYRLPSSVQAPPGPAGDPTDPSLQTFRKYYKFAVTNPLNVKTKVHVPRSPSALLSATEREKIFLEIHVQNMTQEPLWFERLRFESVDGWQARDSNISPKDGKSLFSGPAAIMQPQATRQYVYILTPTSIPPFPVVHVPGTIIPLGRLDLSWRSSFGEQGRLLTSLLTRRIPIPPAQPAASALPPHIQRSSTPVRSTNLPQPPSSRPSTPPLTSPGTFKPRPPSQQIGRPQSPAMVIPPSPVPKNSPNLEVDLVVQSIPRDVHVEQPFQITFQVTLSGILPTANKIRLVHLVVQHLRTSRTAPLSPATESISQLSFTPYPRRSVEISSPKTRHHLRDSETLDASSPVTSPIKGSISNFGLGLSQLRTGSPIAHQLAGLDHSTPRSSVDLDTRRTSSTAVSSRVTQMQLPSPFVPSKLSDSVLPVGASTIFLSPFALSRGLETAATPTTTEPNAPKGEAVQQFQCTFIPVRKGFAAIGGVRILLLEDREIEDADMAQVDDLPLMHRANANTKVLREWDIIGEVWITS